jgi:hypothetical protein
MKCPNCSSLQKEIQSKENVQSLMKNFTLLGIVSKIEKRLTSIISDISQDTKQVLIKSIPVSLKGDNSELFSEHYCIKHHRKAYLEAYGKKTLICEICLKENNIKGYPLTSV